MMHPPAPADFGSALNQSLTEIAAYTRSYHHALDIGVRPKELVSYVKGTLSAEERQKFQGLLARSPWAMNRVVALVKARRHEDWLGYRVHTIQILNHYAREHHWVDEELEGCKLLDALPDPPNPTQ